MTAADISTGELLGSAGGSEAATVASIAAQATEPHTITPGELYTVADGNGGVKILDTDAYDIAPRRAKARRVVTNAESFVAYVNRHKIPGTEVFADTPASTVAAVIDSHEGSTRLPGWQGHRLDLSLEHTKAWLAWARQDLGANPRAWFSQAEFAEFIEDRALDVVEPDHARLIDIAMTFEAKSKAEFTSSRRLDNGDVHLDFVETTAAKSGAKGDIEIPKQLKLALRPYIGGPIYFVFAQFRYRLNGGDLKLGYALERPENILEAAFADVVTEIREGKKVTSTETKKETVIHDGIGDVPIFFGRP